MTKQVDRFPHFQDLYNSHVQKHLRGHFPDLVSYNRIVELCSDSMLPLAAYLKNFALCDCSVISFIDYTTSRICHNRRIHNHKVFEGLAKGGQCSIGWFYGFKLLLVTSDTGEVIDFLITSGNLGYRGLLI